MAQIVTGANANQFASCFGLPIAHGKRLEELQDCDYLWTGQPVPLVRLWVENIALYLLQKDANVVAMDVLVYLVFKCLTETNEERLSQLLYEYGITANFHTAKPATAQTPREGRPMYDRSLENIPFLDVTWFEAPYKNYQFSKQKAKWMDYTIIKLLNLKWRDSLLEEYLIKVFIIPFNSWFI